MASGKSYISNEGGLELVEAKKPALPSLSDALLKIFQKAKLPKTTVQLKKLITDGSYPFDIADEDIYTAVKVLDVRGYDIKEITQGLVRRFTIIRTPYLSEEDYYKIHGKIETPLLLTSDIHLGSKGFSKLAFDQMMKDLVTYKIKHMMIAGDLLQGRGVHKVEGQDLLIPEISGQIDLAIEYLAKVPKGVTVHLISGNHEEKLQGSVDVGLNALKLVATSLRNVKYYGHVAILQLNGKYKYMMMHGSGGVTTASTHGAEKVWRELIERPDLYHSGHTHQLALVRKGNQRRLIVSGTLQRTNAWLLQKGWNAKIGWYIVKNLTDEAIEVVERSPLIY